MDTVPRHPATVQLEGLDALAEQLIHKLELRRQRTRFSSSIEHERMQAVLARQASHFLQMTGRSAMLGGWVVELPTRRMLLSDEAAAIYEQVPRSMHYLQDTIDFYAPELRKRTDQLFTDCARFGTAFDEDAEIITGTNRRLWVRTIGQEMRDASGAITGLLGTTTNISNIRKAEDDARRLATRLTVTLESITDAFFALDRDWRYTYLYRQSERLLLRRRDELLGDAVWNEFRTAVRNAGGVPGEQVPDGVSLIEFEQLYLPTNAWFEIRVFPSEDCLSVYVRDVTERRQGQEQLRLLELSVSRLNDLVMITEASGEDESDHRVVFVNDAFARMTGYPRDEILGESLSLLQQGPPTDRVGLKCISDALSAQIPSRTELITRKEDGSRFWLDLDLVPVKNCTERATHWVAVGRDVTHRKAAEDRIQRLAYFDPLTQLRNRLVLMERLKPALRPRPNGQGAGALMFIDLDNFKTLNDTLGHHEGDLLLQQVAKRLAESVQQQDTVARLGVDECVVLLEELSAESGIATAHALAAAEKIRVALSAPYRLGGVEHYGTCSIGVTSLPVVTITALATRSRRPIWPCIKPNWAAGIWSVCTIPQCRRKSPHKPL